VREREREELWADNCEAIMYLPDLSHLE